jgi:torulene dioxygenase
VFYRSRRTADKHIQALQKTGKLSSSFGQKDLCDSFFHKFFTNFIGAMRNGSRSESQAMNVQVTLTTNFPAGDKLDSSHRDKSGSIRNLYVKTDANALQILDPVTLELLEDTSYTKLVPGTLGMSVASHPAIDPDTGELFNFALNFGRVPSYTLFKLTPPTMEVPSGHQILATITDAPAAYIHSVGLTKKYFIFCVWQADYRLNGATIPYHRNLVQAFSPWDANRKTIWYVVNRNGGMKRKFESDAFFAFHQINSYDEGDNVVVHLSTYENYDMINSLYLDVVKSTAATKELPPATITRVVLKDINESTTTGTAMVTNTSTFIELPTISSSYSLRPNKYVYGVSSAGISSLWDSIVKVDMDALYANPTNPPKGAIKRFARPQCTPSEPIFVPRPGGTREDDGIILLVELDGNKGKSALVILDASTFEEVGRAEVGGDGFIVPHGFHGLWYGSL